MMSDIRDQPFAIVEEQARILMQTAFSTVVREAGDGARGPATMVEDQTSVVVATGCPARVDHHGNVLSRASAASGRA